MSIFLRFLILTGALLGVTSAAAAQTILPVSNFGVRLSNGSSQRVVNLGDSKSRVIQVLGRPTKTSRFYSEIDQAWMSVLHYGSNELYFEVHQGGLGLVELHDARLTVGRPGTAGFHVGSVLPKPVPGQEPLAFGKFLVVRKPGKSRNLAYQAISYGGMKTAKGQVVDVLYEIQYDHQGRVAHIFLDQTYD